MIRSYLSKCNLTLPCQGAREQLTDGRGISSLSANPDWIGKNLLSDGTSVINVKSSGCKIFFGCPGMSSQSTETHSTEPAGTDPVTTRQEGQEMTTPPSGLHEIPAGR